MADVRCPMCGKPNPSEAEVCQFCQARIKPLISPGSSNPSPSPESSSTPPSQAVPPALPGQPPVFGEDLESEPGLPDWLRALRPDGGPLPAQSFSPEEDLPEWLPEEDESGSEEGSTPQMGGGAEDWLSDLRPGGTAEFGPSSGSGDAGADWWPAGENIPDWLNDLPPNNGSASSFPAETALPEAEEPENAGPDEEVEPEWLQKIRSHQRAEQGEVEEVGARESGAREGGAGEDDAGEGGSAAQAADLFGLPDDTPFPLMQSQEEGVPEWLASFEMQPSDDPGEPGPEPQETHDWLPETQDSAPDEGEEIQPVPPFKFDPEDTDLDELGDWLAGSAGQEEAQEAGLSRSPFETPGEEPGLAPADLPAWLEAMRPVEAAAPSAPISDDTDQVLESSGPLSGLSGVIPAEPEISRLKKPSAYSVKLRVSETQQAHANVFEELIKAEGAARPIPSRPAVSSQYFLRLLIFLVLLLGIGWTVFTGSQSVSLPDVPDETVELSNAISRLSSGSPVLLAVDYQPGLSAEMDAIAAPVVDHLMLQGAYLALVSTSPSGPAQAERLLRIANTRGGHQYQDIGQYANLGFIPGGPAGLLGFAEAPRRMMPFALDGNLGWESESLRNVNQLENFALAVVITENPDTARTWIEQAQPFLGDAPLMMVLSAQAEPFVRPYYDGNPRQVQGMVTGLAGGASYEKLLGREGLARKYWDAYSLSLPLAAGLILIGGTIYGIATALANRKRTKAEASV